MASIFGHGLLGYTLAKVIDKKEVKILTLLAVGSSMLPDADVIGFYNGIEYSSPLGHRGFTHSILFAIIWAILLAVIFGKTRKFIFFSVIFLATISHGILDAMTTGGEGVGFFIPLDNTRYFFELRPIKISPIGIRRFFSAWGMQVILSELVWIGIPCLFILLLKKLKNHNK